MTEEFYFLKQNEDGEFEQHEPYITVSVDTEEDYEFMKQAIEKQKPKKPKGETDPMFGDITTVCPTCGNANLVNPFVRSRVYDYCPNCGQKLDWSEENGNK